MFYIDIDINKYLGKSIERAGNLSFARVLNPKSYKIWKQADYIVIVCSAEGYHEVQSYETSGHSPLYAWNV